MTNKKMLIAATDRRGALVGIATGLILSKLAKNNEVAAAVRSNLEPAAAEHLHALIQTLSQIPRRRDFKTVPMILDQPEQWDAEAIATVLGYKGAAKLAWDNTDLAGPWLNGMRNSMNSQIWSFKEPNFLCVSATHGTAHLALYDQDTWDKYQLAKLAGGNVARNTFIIAPPASLHDPVDFGSAEGPFSSFGNSIPVLQQRGAVFMACHNAIWEHAEKLVSAGQNPDHLTLDAIAAELTNHLIPDVVLTPGIVATLVKLQQSGFAYAR